MSRHNHNAKTRGRWRNRQPVPGLHLWRSPHGFIHLVDADGTHDLGRGTFAQQVWQAADPKQLAKAQHTPAA